MPDLESQLKEMGFTKGKFLGKGAFGEVWRYVDKSGHVVAIKTPIEENEATIAAYLAQIIKAHPELPHDKINIIESLNVGEVQVLLSQYESYKDSNADNTPIEAASNLEEFIINVFHPHQETKRAGVKIEQAFQENLSILFAQIAYEMYLAQAQLHKFKIIHKDISTRNYLINLAYDDNGNILAIQPKISDYGKAGIAPSGQAPRIPEEKLAGKWMNLEVLEGKNATIKTDLFSQKATFIGMLGLAVKKFNNEGDVLRLKEQPKGFYDARVQKSDEETLGEYLDNVIALNATNENLKQKEEINLLIEHYKVFLTTFPDTNDFDLAGQKDKNLFIEANESFVEASYKRLINPNTAASPEETLTGLRRLQQIEISNSSLKETIEKQITIKIREQFNEIKNDPRSTEVQKIYKLHNLLNQTKDSQLNNEILSTLSPYLIEKYKDPTIVNDAEKLRKLINTDYVKEEFEALLPNKETYLSELQRLRNLEINDIKLTKDINFAYIEKKLELLRLDDPHNWEKNITELSRLQLLSTPANKENEIQVRIKNQLTTFVTAKYEDIKKRYQGKDPAKFIEEIERLHLLNLTIDDELSKEINTEYAVEKYLYYEANYPNHLLSEAVKLKTLNLSQKAIPLFQEKINGLVKEELIRLKFDSQPIKNLERAQNIKNNIQIIDKLLKLQSFSTDEETKNQLNKEINSYFVFFQNNIKNGKSDIPLSQALIKLSELQAIFKKADSSRMEIKDIDELIDFLKKLEKKEKALSPEKHTKITNLLAKINSSKPIIAFKAIGESEKLSRENPSSLNQGLRKLAIKRLEEKILDIQAHTPWEVILSGKRAELIQELKSLKESPTLEEYKKAIDNSIASLEKNPLINLTNTIALGAINLATGVRNLFKTSKPLTSSDSNDIGLKDLAGKAIDSDEEIPNLRTEYKAMSPPPSNLKRDTKTKEAPAKDKEHYSAPQRGDDQGPKGPSSEYRPVRKVTNYANQNNENNQSYSSIPTARDPNKGPPANNSEHQPVRKVTNYANQNNKLKNDLQKMKDPEKMKDPDYQSDPTTQNQETSLSKNP